jgi:Tfp pilus assembly ATPase PilU
MLRFYNFSYYLTLFILYKDVKIKYSNYNRNTNSNLNLILHKIQLQKDQNQPTLLTFATLKKQINDQVV